MYLDMPERRYKFVSGGTGPGEHHQHAEGSSQVQDLAEFIACTVSLAYLVFRDMKCDDNMRWDIARQSSVSGDLRHVFNDSIAIINTELRSCIDGIARCAPNSDAYFEGSRSSTKYMASKFSSTKDSSERDLHEVKSSITIAWPWKPACPNYLVLYGSK
jgi:hypothetical protein